MEIIKLVLISIALVGIAISGIAIKLLVNKKAEFSGGSCRHISPELKEKGITCGCQVNSCEIEQSQ
ncbi:membrane or secreted protein [Bacteroidota bacterium]